ncbi:MAG TPA: FlgD immunoglobulin-like domain containing protein [Candidatus Eisenbacteria bacterium]|nr:FlgD immunoglobulin-like domain containing protein [Candidatus Eisenbacteria bacterium]
MHHRLVPPAGPRAIARALLFASFTLLAPNFAPRASATVQAVSIDPAAPTLCDSVRLIVGGYLPAPCYTIRGFRVGAPEPLPTMGPIPTYRIRALVRAEEPDPATQPNCVTVIEPYRLARELGRLPFGNYWVEAREYLYPFPADSASSPIDSSLVRFDFFVGPDSCRAGAGCALFGFAEAGTGIEPRVGCTARTLPGGRACFDVTLANDTPVGAFQTAVAIPTGGGAFVADFPNLIVPVEVTATPRAAGFQVAWARDETRTKIVLYSTTGAVLQPGRGPVLHLCYDVKEGTPEGSYSIGFGPTLVSTPVGDVIPLCPTFAEIQGRLCVGEGGCDLNGDGVGNIRDILRLVRCVLQDSSDFCPDSVRAHADCNGDDHVDVRDIVCCVRKTLLSDAGWGPFSPVASGFSSDLSAVRFEGPVEPVSSDAARATVAIDRGPSFGGVQFMLDAGTAARVERVSFDDPSRLSSFDWQPLADGRARVMIYNLGPTVETTGDASGSPSTSLATARVFVTLRRNTFATDEGYLALDTVRGATNTGDVLSFAGGVYQTPLPTAYPPAAPAILPARPNPFISDTEISYSLPSAASVSVRVFDVRGRLVRTLQDGPSDAGVQRLRWDGRDDMGRTASVGIYFVRFDAGNTLQTQRILRLR